MDRLIGKTFGPYQVLEKIGEGGMGVVYKGFQESLNRSVVIKVLRGELAHDEQFIARFHTEALLIAKLRHPNIVTVYDFGIAHGVYYIVMEYVEGGSLKELIQRGPLPVDRAATIAAQVADALDYAHRQRMVHRDIKPANILLTRDGQPRLTDFGIARALDSESRLTRTGTSIGTPEYMAPEQVQGEATDGRTDIYALGIVLYEMLTGLVPFSAHTPMATLYKQVNEPPPRLQLSRANTPAWLELVVNRALAKRPEARYQQAGDLATALHQGAVSGAAPTARPQRPKSPPPIEPAVQQKTSRALVIPLVAAIAVLLLGLVAGGAFLLLGASSEKPSAQPSPTTEVLAGAPSPTALPAATEPPTPPPPAVTDTSPPPAPPTAEAATQTPVVIMVIATNTPGPVPPTEQAPTAQPTPVPLPSEVPTSRAQATSPPKPTAGIGQPGVIADFENFGTWKRGNEANGTFTQSSAQVHQGSYSGQLSYDFGTTGNDYVVFAHPQSIAGTPTRLTVWVYGDASGHFLNAWIKDKAGQVWQVPYGRVVHSGWQQMAGLIDPNQEWPWTHISGPDNGAVDYPIAFQALVLDDNPDRFSGSGTIYLDDLRAEAGTGGPAGGAPTAAPVAGSPVPTSAPPAAVAGRIAFSAGGALHIVRAATGQDTVAPIPNMRQPDLRRDGQQVIVKGYQGDKTSLWTISTANGSFQRQQSPFTDDYHPFYAPAGNRFVYDSFHHGLGQYQMLYTQQLDDRNDRPEVPVLYGSTQIRGTSPVWMENDWLAFTACDYWPDDQGQIGGSKCGIYRMPSWGGQPAMVKPGSLDMRATDEQAGQLLFMSQESGNWEVYLMPAAGGAAQNLSNGPGSLDGLGTFSPDGKLVAFLSNRGGGWAVWAVRLDGSNVVKLFDLPAAPTVNWLEEHIAWAP